MTSAQASSAALAEVLRNNPYPLLAIDLDDMAILGANEAAYRILGRPPNSLDGVPSTDIVRADDRPAVEAALRLLASRAIEGYHVTRQLRRADGTEFTASAWVRLTTIDGNRFAFATIDVDDPDTALWPLGDTHLSIALAVTDHDWVIEHVSTDVEEILRQSPESYEGSSLLALLQPADAQNFMLAVGRVSEDGGGVTVNIHLRTGESHWQNVHCLIVAMCRHSPPRLGLAFAARAEPGNTESSAGSRQVAVRGVGVLGGMDQLRKRIPPDGFSTRQWEILTRLVRGQRVQEIANALYLSTSTVRNHLTAIYRKFGVHSQAELLASLLNTSD
jgi:PAS domain S-box-containing protein